MNVFLVSSTDTSTLPEEIDNAPRPPTKPLPLSLSEPASLGRAVEPEPLNEARSFWGLIAVFLLASGVAGTAYAGVRIVVDQRMAALYGEPASLAGWGIFIAGLLTLLTGAALFIAIERRT